MPETAYDEASPGAVLWDIDLLGGYPWAAPGSGRTAAGRVSWLVRHFRKTRPEVVICYGWATPIARAAIMYCLLTRTRLLMYGETTWQHSATGRHRMVRAVALRSLMRRCSGAVSTGTFNRGLYQVWLGPAPHLAGRLPSGH